MRYLMIVILVMLIVCYNGYSQAGELGNFPGLIPGYNVPSAPSTTVVIPDKSGPSFVYDGNFNYQGMAIKGGNVTSFYPSNGGRIVTCITMGMFVSCY